MNKHSDGSDTPYRDVPQTRRSAILADISDEDRAALLEFDAITPDTRTFGKPAPYQYLTLLWAIAKASSGTRRLTSYREAKDLSKILKLVSPKADPLMPWFALFKRVPGWWEIELPSHITAADLKRNHISQYNLRAGITRPRFDRIRSDASFSDKVIEFLDTYISEWRDTIRSPEQFLLPGHRPRTRKTRLVEISIENNVAEQFTVTGSSVPTTHKRAEAELQQRFVESLSGYSICRHLISADDTLLVTDLFIKELNELVEVKSSSDRPTIRLALGQILDYSYFLSPQVTTRTIVVPEKPSNGILSVLHEHGVRAAWPETDGRFRYSRD